jgi:hypothetical protein
MPLYELSADNIGVPQRVDFAAERVGERSDLQRLLRNHIDEIGRDFARDFRGVLECYRSDRRIDLLAADQQARLVVIEINTDDSLADLQALRYAAMVSQMTFEEAVDTYKAYLAKRGRAEDAEKSLLDFLGWAEPTAGHFGEEVRIILAAADFSPTWLAANCARSSLNCARL